MNESYFESIFAGPAARTLKNNLSQNFGSIFELNFPGKKIIEYFFELNIPEKNDIE